MPNFSRVLNPKPEILGVCYCEKSQWYPGRDGDFQVRFSLQTERAVLVEAVRYRIKAFRDCESLLLYDR